MAIVLHNVGQNFYTLTAGTSVNLSVNVRDVPERYMVCAIALQTNSGSVNAGSVVYRAETGNASTDQSLTFLGARAHNSAGIRIEFWGLLAPAAGVSSPTVRFTSSVSVRGAAAAVVYSGVNQTTPFTGYVNSTSTPTNLAQSGVAETTSTTGTVGSTSNLTVSTSGPNERVVSAIAFDASATTNNHRMTSGQDLANRLSGSTSSNTVRIGLGDQPAASAGSQTVTWRSFTGGQTAYGTGQSGRAYAHIAFSLKPSASVAPYYVTPPREPVAFPSTTVVNNRWVDISDFPSVGSLTINSLGTGGPTEVTTQNDLNKEYTARTSTNISTGAFVGTPTLGSITTYRANTGYEAGGSIDAYLPPTILENDIMLVTVYTEPDTVTPTQASFTQINTQTSTNMRQTNFWKRMSATDASNAANPANNTKYTFTTTGGTWRTIAVAWYRGCITSRTPYVNATDDAGSTALPTTNTGATGSPVFTGLTTTAVNQTVVFLGAHFAGPTWAPPLSSGGFQEREEFWNCYIGDKPVLTASAVGNQTVTVSNTASTWATTVITLIPDVASQTHTASVASMSGVATTRSVSRLMDNYNRAVTAMNAVATTRTPARKMLPFKRSVTAMNAVATTRSAANVLRYVRGVRAMNQVSTTRTPTRKMLPYKRGVLRFGGVALTIQAIVTPAAADLYQRDVSSMSAVATTRSVARKMLPYKRGVTAMSAVTTTRTVRRTMLPFKRGIAAMNAVATTRTLTRKMAPYKRGVSATSGLARVMTVSYTQPAGVVGWTDYQPTLNAPYLFRIEDIPNTFPGCQFNLLVQIRSQVNGQKVYAKLVTHPTVTDVASSQIETAAPYDAWQLVRSSSISLASNQYYKVQVGKVSPHTGQILWAKLAVRDVA